MKEYAVTISFRYDGSRMTETEIWEAKDAFNACFYAGMDFIENQSGDELDPRIENVEEVKDNG